MKDTKSEAVWKRAIARYIIKRNEEQV